MKRLAPATSRKVAGWTPATVFGMRLVPSGFGVRYGVSASEGEARRSKVETAREAVRKKICSFTK